MAVTMFPVSDFELFELTLNHSWLMCPGETANTLSLPTVTRHGGCEIKLSGKVTLHMDFRGEHKSWS
jgi:hypothetical protein